MPVKHKVPDASTLPTSTVSETINMMFDLGSLPGITQFRVGSTTVTVLDLAVSITFNTPMSTSNYEVFFHPKSGVSTLIWASGASTSGFTMNLSVGVAATISYLAVELV